MKIKLSFEDISRMTHEMLEAYRRAIGEKGYGPYDTLQEEKKTLHRKAVRWVLDDLGLTYKEAHEIWVSTHYHAGYERGEETDIEKKTHPDMVPYDDLPYHQQAKDALFIEAIRAAAPLYDGEEEPPQETAKKSGPRSGSGRGQGHMSFGGTNHIQTMYVYQ